jgi:tetratricopeptide (TPR) repeat protein
VFAHVTVWKDRYAARLEAGVKGEATPIQNFDHENRIIYDQYATIPWEALDRYERDASTRLRAAVQGLSLDELDDKESFSWTNGRPLWQSVSFNVYYHPLDHVSDYLCKRGQFDRARELQEKIARQTAALDDSEAWRSTASYNLACFYALQDQPGRALELLAEAFSMNPNLVEWSKQDHDLDGLRDLTGYRALFVD